MRILDALFGRARPASSKLDQLFGMSTAEITLATELSLTPGGAAAICFKPVSSGDFEGLEREIGDLLRASEWETPLTFDVRQDEYGYRWIVLHSTDLSELVTGIHVVSRELFDAGYGERLLAAVFLFRDEHGGKAFWIYNYKRGTWYPFVPVAGKQRDNARELRLSAVMKGELEVESDLSTWYALWGVPLS